MIDRLFGIIKNKKGLALSELMVATAVLSVLVVSIGNVYGNGQQSYFYIEGSVANMQEARHAVEQVSRDLRTTIQITSATGEQFAFDGDYNGDGTIESISYAKVSKSGGGFTLNRTIGTSTKVVGDGLVNSASEPVFTYYDQEGNVITNGADAKLVEVDLKIDMEANKSPNRSTTVTTKIQLRNLHERR